MALSKNISTCMFILSIALFMHLLSCTAAPDIVAEKTDITYDGKWADLAALIPLSYISGYSELYFTPYIRFFDVSQVMSDREISKVEPDLRKPDMYSQIDRSHQNMQVFFEEMRMCTSRSRKKFGWDFMDASQIVFIRDPGIALVKGKFDTKLIETAAEDHGLRKVYFRNRTVYSDDRKIVVEVSPDLLVISMNEKPMKYYQELAKCRKGKIPSILDFKPVHDLLGTLDPIWIAQIMPRPGNRVPTQDQLTPSGSIHLNVYDGVVKIAINNHELRNDVFLKYRPFMSAAVYCDTEKSVFKPNQTLRLSYVFANEAEALGCVDSVRTIFEQSVEQFVVKTEGAIVTVEANTVSSKRLKLGAEWGNTATGLLFSLHAVKKITRF